MKSDTSFPPDREGIRLGIMRHYSLYKIHPHRLRRLLASPWYTGKFYLLNLIEKTRPFKGSKMMPWGSPMRFYLPEANQIYYYDFWEADFSNFITRFLKPGDVFVDVGAHVGYYSSLAQRLVGDDGAVVALEPTPRTYETLVDNVSKFKNVHTYNVAASDEDTELSFTDYGPAYSAFNTLNKHTEEFETGIGGSGQVIRVKTKRLNDIFSALQTTPTFIKIDAEGAESRVLKGTGNTLQTHRPIVSIEVGGDTVWDGSTKDSIVFLSDLDYLPFEMTVDGYLREHVVMSSYTYNNLIWVPKEKIPQIQNLIVI